MFEKFLVAANLDYSKALAAANANVYQLQLIQAYTAVNTAMKDGSGSMKLAVAKKYGEFITRYMTRA